MIEEISETHDLIEVSERTSSVAVWMPAEVRAVPFEGSRIEAKTVMLAAWRARASASPRLPGEQPVMRAYRLSDVIFVVGVLLLVCLSVFHFLACSLAMIGMIKLFM